MSEATSGPIEIAGAEPQTVPAAEAELGRSERVRRATRTGAAIAQVYLGYKGLRLLDRGALRPFVKRARRGWDRVSARTLNSAAQDLGASDLKVMVLIAVPMLWPALLAAFVLAATLSWDEFVIAFLLSRFDVTLPVIIWSMLRSGLSPELNAAGTIVFAISFALIVVVELLLLRQRRRHG